MAIQSDKEFPSLLFTPRSQDKQPDSSYRTRSPRSTRSPSTPAHGRGSGYREGSRRRSLTPPGGRDRDATPPPPPFLSILDADKGKAAATRPAEASGTDLLAVQDTYDASEPASQDTWVTVYGFTAHDQHVVLREFAKCGNILQFGNGRDDRANWTHIQYATPSQAQRALLKAGQVVAGRIMIGVKPLEQQFRLSIEGLAQDSQGKLSGRVSRQVVMRPHQLDSLPGQSLLPAARNSTWAKVTEFVLGA